MGQSTTPRQRALFVVFLLALFPAGNALQPRLDEDTWWHLAVGRYVVEHRAVPTEDPFSRIGQDEHLPWVAYSWLHEVALYGAYQLGGLSGIFVFRHLLDSLTFLTVAWFVLRRSEGQLQPLVVLALFTATLVPMMLERPWHYTIVFTTLTLHAVIEMRAGSPVRRYWWLLIVFALWANLHIQFVLGFGVLGLGLLTTAVERWWNGETPWRQNSASAASEGAEMEFCPHEAKATNNSNSTRQWAALLIGCVLATLANPYHFRLYQVIWEYASQTGALRVVSELAPPNPAYWWNWALALLLLWAAAACAARRLPTFDTALLIVGAAFSLRMQRDIWFGALTAAVVLANRRGRSEAKPSGFSLASLRPPQSNLVAGLLIAATMAVVLTRIVWAVGPGQGKPAIEVNREAYPAAAVEFVREHRPPGPLYNHFNWGGYLIWALPEYPVGLDGRTNLYGEERLARAFNTWLGADGWERDPDLTAAGVIIAPIKLGKSVIQLTELLRSATDRWRVVYEDDVAVVFVPVK